MRKKRLNIHNTDKMFNLAFLERKKDEFTYVNKFTAPSIKDSLQGLKGNDSIITVRDDKSYIVYQEVMQDDGLIRDVFTYGGFVSYYTEGTIPYHIVELLNMNRKNSRVVVKAKSNYTYSEIQSIARASMSATVVVDAPVVYGVTDYTLLIAGLSRLRYRVDRLELVFPPLNSTEYKHAVSLNKNVKKYYYKEGNKYYLKSDYKYNTFNLIRNACSHWKVYIFMVVDNEADFTRLNKLKSKDEATRKGSISW